MKAHFEKEPHFENESMFLEKVKSNQSFKKLQLAKSIHKEMFKNVGSKFNSLTLCFSSVEVDSFPS